MIQSLFRLSDFAKAFDDMESTHPEDRDYNDSYVAFRNAYDRLEPMDFEPPVIFDVLMDTLFGFSTDAWIELTETEQGWFRMLGLGFTKELEDAYRKAYEEAQAQWPS